ncbi:hypothetical protein AAG589_13205 [Isoptericola sp. F-RaC21]|uniref:hypothetical protein n=1 Tax=Isoptericola sp. F-RaC21 TaxID=3141452 RepID=UPI00315BB133
MISTVGSGVRWIDAPLLVLALGFSAGYGGALLLDDGATRGRLIAVGVGVVGALVAGPWAHRVVARQVAAETRRSGTVARPGGPTWLVVGVGLLGVSLGALMSGHRGVLLWVGGALTAVALAQVALRRPAQRSARR